MESQSITLTSNELEEQGIIRISIAKDDAGVVTATAIDSTGIEYDVSFNLRPKSGDDDFKDKHICCCMPDPNGAGTICFPGPCLT